MPSQNEAAPLAVDLTPAPSQAPPLSPTCEREHADPASFSAHGVCLSCHGPIPPAIRPAAAPPVSLATLTTPDAIDVQASEGAVTLRFRLGGHLGSKVAIVVGVREAHNLSDLLALAAHAAKHGIRGSDVEAAAAVFPGVASYDSDDDAEFSGADVRGWAAAPAEAGRIVCGFCLGTSAGFPERIAAARLLVGAPKDFAARVLRAACQAQSLAQGEPLEPGPQHEAGFNAARAKMRSLKETP